MSQSGDCVVYTVRCGCMPLIHTLPYRTHRTWEDICPPLLSCSGRSVWNYLRTHTLAHRGVNYPHRTPLFYSSSRLTPSKTSGLNRSVLLGKNSVVTAAVCLSVFECVCIQCTKTRGASATEWVYTPRCPFITA